MSKGLLALFRRGLAPRPVAASAPALETKPSVPATPEWTDDSALRALVEDHRRGVCKWILPSDMDALYTWLDARNASLPEAQRVHLEILSSADSAIRDWRERRIHDYAEFERLNQGGGPLVLQGENMIRALGPQGISIRVRMGGETRPAEYCANPLNTYLLIEKPDGAYVRIDFGMGGDIADAFKAAPKTVAGPVKLIPQS